MLLEFLREADLKAKDINKSGLTERKRSCFSCLYPPPPPPPSVWGFGPGRMSTSHWPALSLPPLLSPSTSLSSHPFISPSRGAAFRSELMDLRWCMHSHSSIPSSRERGAVSKKKDDMWDWKTWLDRSGPAQWGWRVRGRKVCGGPRRGRVLWKAKMNKASKGLQTFP